MPRLTSLRWSSNFAGALFSTAQSGIRAAISWGATELEAEEIRRDRRRRRQQKIIACCKQVTAFLFSHIGLAGMVVAYSILGGFLFQAIEKSNELELKQRIRQFKDETIDEIVKLAENITTTMTTLEKEEEESSSSGLNFTEQLRKLFKEKYETAKANGWQTKDFTDERDDVQWSFAGSLLYAVTIITTIGKTVRVFLMHFHTVTQGFVHYKKINVNINSIASFAEDICLVSSNEDRV